MPGPALVKLGGSLLTDKSREGHFKQATTKRLLREIAGTGPTVLLHGAGSFGHPAAARHHIGRTKPSPAAVSEVLTSVARLHIEVLSLAQREGMNPISIPMTGHSAKGILEDVPANGILHALASGFMPVMHGTLVHDDAKGWRVASADEILASLAEALKPRIIIWATDVDGVHSEDPKSDPKATLLDRVGPKTAPSLSESETLDVTGQMGGKIRHATKAARHASTLILNGGVPGRLRSALQSQTVPGTWVDPA